MKTTLRQVQQVTRLARVVDVIYALMLWRIFSLLPRPVSAEGVETTALALLVEESGTVLVMLLLTVMLAVFWHQSNILLGSLRATDGAHTTISIFQLLFILLLFYSITLGIVLGTSATGRAMESGMALVSSALAFAGWKYATRKGYLSEDLSDLEADQIAERNLAEPLTALITLPFAFIGAWMWEVSWVIYPLVKWWFRRRARQMGEVAESPAASPS